MLELFSTKAPNYGIRAGTAKKIVRNGLVTMNQDAQGGNNQEEILVCNLEEMPVSVTCVICFVCVYSSGKTFGNASNIAIQLDDVHIIVQSELSKGRGQVARKGIR